MIIVEILNNDSNELQSELVELKNNGAVIIESKSFDGTAETIQILLELSEKILPYIVTFIVARLDAKRYISIKRNGTEITGLTKGNALDILGTITDSDAEKAAVAKMKAEADKEKAEAKKVKAEAEKIKAEAEKIRAEADKIIAETEHVRNQTATPGS